MDDSQRVTVDISAELIAAVNEAVDSGLYASADDIINDALSLWRESQSHDRLWTPAGTSCSPEEHDVWFRSQVQGALDNLATGKSSVSSHDEHLARWQARRAKLLGGLEQKG